MKQKGVTVYLCINHSYLLLKKNHGIVLLSFKFNIHVWILEVVILLDMMYLKCTSKIRSEFSIIKCAIYVTVRFPIVHVFFMIVKICPLVGTLNIMFIIISEVWNISRCSGWGHKQWYVLYYMSWYHVCEVKLYLVDLRSLYKICIDDILHRLSNAMFKSSLVLYNK